MPLIHAADDARFALLGGTFVGEGALLRFYVLHCVGLPLGIAVLMAVHFWRVRKDGGISRTALGTDQNSEFSDFGILNSEFEFEDDMGFIKGIFNAVADPRLFFLLAVAGARRAGLEARADRRRTPSATACSGFLAVFFVFGTFDPNFRLIVTKPDNVPIVGLIFLLVFFIWYSIREGGAERSADRGRAGADREGGVRPRVGLARPGLHRADLADRLLGGPDRLVDRPEGAARAAGQPGEHAEPVEGAVVLPRPAGNAGLLRSVAGRRRAAGLIIVGLMAFPYIDKNPKGNGYYTFNERKAEITIFLFGFVVLWSSLIVLGTFLRGPNWNFFGPFEFWDIHKLEALTNVNLSEYIWVRALRTGLPTQLVRPRDLRHPAGAVLRVRAAGAAREGVVQGLLREARARRATT